MPFDLFEPFQETLRRQALWSPGDPVLVAASGGPDSTCLLDLFARLRDQTHFPLAVAHLHHGLRGREADEDQDFVAVLARRRGLPFHTERLAEGALAGTGEGLEAAGRRARYAFLEETARRTGAIRVALGHTGDDQVETLLLHLLRGAGRRGLAGMRPIRDGRFVRPLLGVFRREIEGYLKARELTSRRDSSNLDLTRTRNRIRNHLLPILRESYNPEIDAVLSRTVEILGAEESYLEGIIDDLEDRFLRRLEDGVRLSIPTLRTLPPALRRRLLRRALDSVISGTGPAADYDRVEALERMVEKARHGAAKTLGKGLEARVLYADLALLPTNRPPSNDEVPLPIPGEASLPDSGVRLRAERIAASQVGDPRSGASPNRALLDADSLPGPLVLRHRRPGDSFRPLGSPGEAKLKSYLIDRKVPRPVRDRIPLVVSGSRIAWVVGFQIDDRFKLTPGTRRVLVLSKEMR